MRVVIKSQARIGKVMVGYDTEAGGLIRRSKARLFRDALQQRIDFLAMDCEAVVDNDSGDIAQLIEGGAGLVVISPMVLKYVTLDGINEAMYYILTEDEYMNTVPTGVFALLRELMGV